MHITLSFQIYYSIKSYQFTYSIAKKLNKKSPKTLIISLSKFLFVFYIIFEFYVKMLKFLGITIALLTIELVGVTITLIIVTTTGDDQELNQSTIITIGDIRQEFNRSDSFVLWITIGAETVELVALMVIIEVKHWLDKIRHDESNIMGITKVK